VAPAGVTVEVDALHGARAVTVDATGEYARAALAALEEVWGKRPVRIRTGGSIPIVAAFAEALAAPVLLLGFGLESDRLHSPNEKLDLVNFYQGIRSVARLLDRFGELAEAAR
jgi:acetylornithine deacetylase/succinyl-diaminopimelate desuccinylase-like protein